MFSVAVGAAVVMVGIVVCHFCGTGGLVVVVVVTTLVVIVAVVELVVVVAATMGSRVDCSFDGVCGSSSGHCNCDVDASTSTSAGLSVNVVIGGVGGDGSSHKGSSGFMQFCQSEAYLDICSQGLTIKKTNSYCRVTILIG